MERIINAIESGPSVGRAVVGIITLAVVVIWYFFSIVDYYYMVFEVRTPPLWIDYGFFFALLGVIFFSLFNVFLTFAWVTLGLLLNPGRVAAFFVGFLTIFAVVVLKISSLSQLLKKAEGRLHLTLYKIFTGKKAAEIPEEEFNTVETLKLEGPKLVDYFKEHGLNEVQAGEACARVLSFRRFRVRFLLGSLFGTLFILLSLIVFILLGVEAFRQGSTAVTSIGSVLEGGAGASSAVSDKLGDKEADIQNLVFQFTSKKIGTLKLRGHNSTVELNSMNENLSPTDIVTAVTHQANPEGH